MPGTKTKTLEVFFSRTRCQTKDAAQGSQADKYEVWVLLEPRVSDFMIRDAFCSCPVGDGGPLAVPLLDCLMLMNWSRSMQACCRRLADMD